MPKKEKNKDNIDDIIEKTFSHIKDIVDANTVIGTVIKITEDIIVLPISRISVGLVSGGGNITKNKNSMTAGSGTGFNIEPVGFVAINGGILEFLPVHAGSDLGVSVVDSVVKIFDRYLEKSGENNEEK